jgi:hypothetical protein
MIMNNQKTDITNMVKMAILISIGYIVMFYVFSEKNILLKIPRSIKCALDESKCDENDLSMFTVSVSIIYLLVGYMYPNYYFTAIVITYITQVIKYNMGYPTSLIIDPLANVTGYTIGSVISPPQLLLKEKYQISNKS